MVRYPIFWKELNSKCCVFLFIFVSNVCIVVTSFGQGTVSYFFSYFHPVLDPVFSAPEFVKLDFQWTIPGSVQTFMNAGLTNLDNLDFVNAEKNFSEVSRLSPSFSPGFYYLGASLKAQAKFADAEKVFRKVLELEPTCWQASLGLAQVLQFQRMDIQAGSQYRHTISLQPNAPEPFFYMANFEMRLGNRRRALKFYQKSTDVNKDFTLGFTMQAVISMVEKEKETLALFDRALQIDSLNKEALFWRGLYLINNSKHELALKDWDKLVQYYPAIPFFTAMRAFLNIDMGRFDQAFNDLRKMVLLKPVDEKMFIGGQSLLDQQIDIQYATHYAMRKSYGLSPEAFDFFKKGFCFFILRKYDRAVAEFKNAEALESAAVIYFLLALTHEHNKDHALAFEYYTKAIDLDADIFDAYKKRAIYLTELRDWKRANEDYNAMIRLQPETFLTYKLRGLTKFAFKDYYGAIVDFGIYLKSDPTSGEVLINRAACLDSLKNFRSSAEDYLKAAEYDSTNEDILELSARRFLQAGDTLRASDPLKLRVTRFPNKIMAWLELAQLQMWLLQLDDARRSIQIAFASQSKSNYTTPGVRAHLLHVNGMLYYLEKNYQASIIEFTRAMEVSASPLPSQYYRAKSYLYAGEKRLASKEFKYLSKKGYLDSQAIYNSLRKDESEGSESE